MEINLAYYKKKDWFRFLKMIDDRESMFDTWKEWNKSFSKTEQGLISQGFVVNEIIVDLEELKNRVTHLGRINSDLFKSKGLVRYAPLDDLVQYRSAVVPSVEPEEIFIDIFLQVFPVAPRMYAP